MIIRMTVLAPIARGLASILGGGSGGGGGLLGLIGIGGSSGSVATPGFEGITFDNFGGAYANGGFLGAGKWGIAGERGPEVVRGPAQITPVGGGLSINYAPVLDMRGATGVTEGQVRGMLAEHYNIVKQTLPGLVKDARDRRRI
jgi:hypothetical protein